MGSLAALSAAIEARDPYARGHSSRVTVFAQAMARRLRLDKERLAVLRLGALLHDVGKLVVPSAVLLKRGPLTEEELAILDLLTKPEMKLTAAEEREVKKVAKQLLETLKREKLVLDWKKRQSTRAAVRYTIETVFDELPRTYTADLYEQKCQTIYQHIFESYPSQGKSLYAEI